jgi:hypothetical protein
VRESLFGVVEIAIAKEFYSAPRAFQIAFQAREETLQYYIVASNYPPADFDQLAVADAGFSLEQRPEVKFTKVPAGAFTPAEIPTSILGNADVKVVLFRSQAPVARRAQGRQRLQLSKNGEPIIGNLCQPGAERSNSDLIVHLAKPKP